MVGGGISGLVAARRVAHAGHDVLLVEARDRVGGRVLNHHLSARARTARRSSPAARSSARPRPHRGPGDGAGGPDVHRVQHRQVGLHLLDDRRDGSTTAPSRRTRLILPDAANLQAQIDQYAAEIPVDAPWTHPRAAEWDAMTLGEFIYDNAANEEGIAT